MSLLNNCSQIAWKHLSAVEIDSYISNQHEFHGAYAFKNILGYNKQNFHGTIYYISNYKTDYINTALTWYDAREHINNRSEYRLYYVNKISSFIPNENDILLLSKNLTGHIIIIIVNDPAIKQQILAKANYFKSYYNNSSYYADLIDVPFLTNLI